MSTIIEEMTRGVVKKVEIKCAICGSRTYSDRKKTCSDKCRYELAYKTRRDPLHNAKKRYKNRGKEIDMINFWFCICFGSNSNLNFKKNIFTFQGAGLFTDEVYRQFFREYKTMSTKTSVSSYHAIDQSEYLIKKAKEKYPNISGLNFYYTTLKACLSNPNNQQWRGRLNFIWLDYCGQLTEDKLTDIELVSKYLPERFFFFITLYNGRENISKNKDERAIFTNHREELIDSLITNRINGFCFYKNKYSHMTTYGYTSFDIYSEIKEIVNRPWEDNGVDKIPSAKRYESIKEMMSSTD